MSESQTYESRRAELFTYFDDTAVDAWARLTSDDKVSGVRATVRAGRDAMRAALLGWLPGDLRRQTLYDAGCGTGTLAVEAARRGARVTAVDLSPTLVGLAQERLPEHIGQGQIHFSAGDMLTPPGGPYDYTVAMDSLIHYELADMVAAVTALTRHTRRALVFTYAPSTPLLSAMHLVGRMFPRGDRAPAIEPVSTAKLQAALKTTPALAGWRLGRTQRIASGFYISHGMELVKK